MRVNMECCNISMANNIYSVMYMMCFSAYHLLQCRCWWWKSPDCWTLLQTSSISSFMWSLKDYVSSVPLLFAIAVYLWQAVSRHQWARVPGAVWKLQLWLCVHRICCEQWMYFPAAHLLSQELFWLRALKNWECRGEIVCMRACLFMVTGT